MSQPQFGATSYDRERRLKSGGYRVVTSLDITAQDSARKEVTDEISDTSKNAILIAAVQPGIADALTDLLLVAVHLGGVDVAVADLQRRTDCGGSLIRFDLENAEAQLRDGVAVIEGDRRDRTHRV